VGKPAMGVMTLVFLGKLYRRFDVKADIIIKFDSAHVGTEGIVIPPGGNFEPMKVPQNAIYAISGSAAQSTYAVEGN
jgi:hypothetical protein